MKKYHLATFLVLLETLSSDAIFTNNGNYCTPFSILCFLYNSNYSIHIRMFVRSNEHSNPAKFVWALIRICMYVLYVRMQLCVCMFIQPALHIILNVQASMHN